MLYQRRKVTLLPATGSEVQLAIEAQKKLAQDKIDIAVVRMPSWDLFEKQSIDYKKSILPSDVKIRLAVERGTSLGGERYTGDEGSKVFYPLINTELQQIRIKFYHSMDLQ